MAAPLTVVAQPRGDEPIAVPRSIKQGIDFVYVDPQMTTVQRRQRPRNWLARVFRSNSREAEPNPMFTDLADGLERYRATWGALPQVKMPAGAALKRGATGRRVQLLRTRLGLAPSGGYDDQLVQVVTSYQRVHGLGKPDGIAGRATLASLNPGARHYARRGAITMERAFRLPAKGKFDRYVVIDSGAAEALLFQRDRFIESMRVVVGAPKSKTPLMAVIMRNAKVNPYWNVPPDLIRTLTAKKALEQGPANYVANFHYEVLSDWSENARLLDPRQVNWKQVAAGKDLVRVRQLPGPWNAMGAMKFEMPNDYGIYLHDTPHKELFQKDERWLSNGCVRLEDYRRFASWVFGRPPQPSGEREEVFQLPRPVPVFMTYFTVAPGENGVTFHPDPYGHDAEAMPQMFGGGTVAMAERPAGERQLR